MKQNVLQAGGNFFSVARIFLINLLIVNWLMKKQVRNFPPFSPLFPPLEGMVENKKAALLRQPSYYIHD